MFISRRDTIAAIATAPGRAAVGIVRISGSQVPAIARGITGRELPRRIATVACFRDDADQPIDHGLAVYFPAPNSYTGEDVFELHGHGGSVVLQLLLRRCVELGARPAEPGEFTQRAFLNGKVDLAQAEGVIDLIDASTERAARSAVRSLQGAFSSKVQEVARPLVELRALVEATLDFPEEEIDAFDRARVRESTGAMLCTLDALLIGAKQGSILRDGIHVVLAGKPNVGKSSLLNALAGQERAIVTDVPGTTRDLVRDEIDIEGIPVHVTDTAGLRATDDAVERIGIERARAAMDRADLLLEVVEAGSPSQEVEVRSERIPVDPPRITVVNKIDLIGAEPRLERDERGSTVWLSAKTGEGVSLLRSALRDAAGIECAAETTFLARERHVLALKEARTRLGRAAACPAPELVAEELRHAHQALMQITGEFATEDLLGEIFSRFCIGK